ncbi:pentatricopeptide repeat-containing protein At5g15010, mitochondrial [Nicotiana tomentosiformis]|uniref:pentatricopeptide repeat-containing protein At5g15010, mitochondrial n=1 Tax=Nicotiana tomentosiformis TaxID=4098 RepID=UPI00051CA31D|nr:pentatricopeptide repeat-containing protein At5g15010, mitochondrial [Nicotiana tomentosiformis]XP_016474571.1 PREDICTED: pentatricopeptide repeat-containing protein At5g15010, mitochondrial-like [Nicotiana tabacum]
MSRKRLAFSFFLRGNHGHHYPNLPKSNLIGLSRSTSSVLVPQRSFPHGFALSRSNRVNFFNSGIRFSTFSSSSNSCSDSEQEDSSEHSVLDHKKPYSDLDLETIEAIFREPGSNAAQVHNKLEQCGVRPTQELVAEVLSRVRNNWEVAFTFFIWASKQTGYVHSVRQYHSMISILGKMRKFDTAWSLIDEMRGGKDRPSLVNPQTLLIMIRKYCAIHDVGKAISTFYAFKRFKFDMGMEEFQDLLSALCRYKNVKDAEHLLFCNKNVFPLNTKSLNIILNGWCLALDDLNEGKRIWRFMKEKGIPRDVFSYCSIMSCYSRAGRLNVVLKLFNEMKLNGVAADVKVHNAVIHALAKGRLVKQARSVMKMMEENDLTPNTVTYNSLIMPLCKARLLDEAQEVFNEMIQRGIHPTVRTYHALLRCLRTGEEVFEHLQKMNMMGCIPTHDTYIMLIRKFCRWCQLDNVFKLWGEMSKNGLDHDRSSYIVLIHGLFLNGKIEESYKYYQEMKQKGLLSEPKIDEMLQAWVAGRSDFQENKVKCSQENKERVKFEKADKERDYLKIPETRRVMRERGFSFWD